MNKKFWGLLGFVIALIVTFLVYFLIKNPRKSTLNLAEIEFAVKDTASIQKVTLTAYIEGNPVSKVYLTKKETNWWVNEKFKAQNTAVEHLLQTIYAIQMQQPLHPNAIENVKKLIKKRNIHVIIQNSNGTILKGYYIGPATPDSKGNYVILEGAENPYIAEIPGFQGYLSTRFSANPDVWRDYTLWNIQPDDFQKFELKDKTQNTLIKVEKKNQIFYINNHPFQDTQTVKNLQKTYFQCIATGLAKTTFPNSKDSLSKITADFTLQLNHQKYLLWTNPFGAFFIVAVKNENQKQIFDGEVMLLQKLTVQKWLFNPKENPPQN